MLRLRTVFLLVLLSALSWFAFGQPLTAHALVRRVRDGFDHRPARRILILGNSRTYFNDMPDMLREVADSAGTRERYDVVVDAKGGASLESMWNDPQVRDLLRQRWADVVVQSESRAEASEEEAASFQQYGTRLLGAARASGGVTRFVVNWNYDESMWEGADPDGSGHDAYYAAIQSASQALAERTGARRTNIGRLWGLVRRDHPAITLTQDGNHPTLAGSYLYALLLYGDLSGQEVGAVTYVPAGLDAATAAMLRRAASDYERLGE